MVRKSYRPRRPRRYTKASQAKSFSFVNLRALCGESFVVKAFDFPRPTPVHSSHEDFQFFEMPFRFARLCRVAKTGKRVQFPRCRATVSEKIAAVHWEIPGKAVCRIRMLRNPRILTRKARRPA